MIICKVLATITTKTRSKTKATTTTGVRGGGPNMKYKDANKDRTDFNILNPVK